jgi:hypothetical protein
MTAESFKISGEALLKFFRLRYDIDVLTPLLLRRRSKRFNVSGHEVIVREV